jgi:uncharacterized protein
MIVDSDSHFLEPLDWLDVHFPALAAQLPPADMVAMLVNAVVGDDVMAHLPPAMRPDPLSLVPPMLRDFLVKLNEGERTGAAFARALATTDDPDAQAMATLWSMQGVADSATRIDFLDEHGIDRQIVLPSGPGFAPSIRASRTGDEALVRECLAAYNTWASDTLSDHVERLIPVTLLDLGDVQWAIGELTRMRARGSRVFNVKAAPVGNRSLAHPDFDPVWSAAEDLGMAVMFHVGAGRPTVDPGWADGGTGSGVDYIFLCATQAHQVPELALGSMIFGGVFERHPRLYAFASELGIAWVPDWLHNMDLLAVGQISQFRPLQYRHPLKPSEYAARQIFVTPLPSQPLNPTIGLTPPGMIAFATDYPHPEGAPDAGERFRPQLDGLSDDDIAAFYGDRVAVALEL